MKKAGRAPLFFLHNFSFCATIADVRLNFRKEDSL